MTRTLVLVIAVIGVALSGRPAEAADAPDTACPSYVVSAVRSTLPAAINLRCHKTRSQVIDGRTVDGTVTGVTAEVALARGGLATYELSATGQVRSVRDAHGDLIGSSGKGMALLFWAFALATVAGAVFVVTRRNLIAAVMGMVGSFLGIAAIYMMLYAQFLAVIQMLVYAGAIMVLFVFVVMILNRPEDEPVAPSGRFGQALGALAILYLVGRLVLILVEVQPTNLVIATMEPAATPQGHAWGSVRAVGTDLFGPGLFPFEAISILLLVAVVGAIAIARPLRAEDDVPAKTRSEGGVA